MRESIGRYPSDIQVEFIHLVGTIVTWWARTEGAMVDDLPWLREFPVNSKDAAQEAFPTQTRRAIRHWGKLLRNAYAGDVEKLAKVEAITDEAFALLDLRNFIIHSFWPYAQNKPDEISLFTITPKPGYPSKLVRRSRTFTVEELDDINNRMMRLYHRVFGLSGDWPRLHRLHHPPKDDTGEG